MCEKSNKYMNIGMKKVYKLVNMENKYTNTIIYIFNVWFCLWFIYIWWELSIKLYFVFSII